MSAEQNDPRLLIRYFLGPMTDTEAERLDELGVTDDELACRLAETENDLVDAYVRGELTGEDLDRFEKHYLSSEMRRGKVMFAEALRDRLERGLAISPEQARPVAALLSRRVAPLRALAAAAALLLLAAGYLLFANGRLRQELSAAQLQTASLQTSAEGIKRELERQRGATIETREQAAGGGVTQAMIERLQIVSLILYPQRRGLGEVVTLSLSPETNVVALQLQLESDEFPRYEVAVKSAADNRLIWKSGKIRSVAANRRKLVTASIPAALLEPGYFAVDLSGAASEKPPELLESYAFRAVVR